MHNMPNNMHNMQNLNMQNIMQHQQIGVKFLQLIFLPPNYWLLIAYYWQLLAIIAIIGLWKVLLLLAIIGLHPKHWLLGLIKTYYCN